MRIPAAVVNALVAGALMAVAPVVVAAPAHADEADDAFIGALDENGISYKSPEDAIQMARKVCDLLGPGGEGLEDAARYLDKATRYSQRTMLNFGGAAIGAYCPDNAPQAPADE